MDKQEKRRIRVKINDLTDSYCQRCYYNSSDSNETEKEYRQFCAACPIGLQLKTLGQKLEGVDIQSLINNGFTKETYIELKRMKVPNRRIAKEFHIGVQTINNRIKEWGLFQKKA